MKLTKINLANPVVMLLLILVVPTAAQQASNADLVLQGHVRSIQRVPSEPDYVRFDVELNVDFVNQGKQPIIFLLPQQSAQTEIFQVVQIALVLSKLQADEYPYHWDIWKQGMRSSNDRSPHFREMLKRLDQPLPPSDVTRILKPAESWMWKTTVQLRFYSQTPTRHVNRSSSTSDLGWDVIGQIGTPLWMRLTYLVWSHNLLRADKGIRSRLQKRWKQIGYLITESEIDTQAIELKFNELSLNDAP